MVGTPLAGRASGSSAASSTQRCYFTMPLFPLNAFYLNFKASPALFFPIFFITFLLCMVMPLEQNRPWNQKTRVLETETACLFSRSLSLALYLFSPPPHRQIFAFHISLANSREAASSSVSAPQVFSARWEEKAYLACLRIASPFLPIFAVAASEMYLHIHPPLCDIANKARHERFVFVCVFLKRETGSNRLVWLRVSSHSHCQR